MSSYARAVLIFVFTTVGCIAPALAQTESATISGRVTDASGAIVVGAEVEIQSIERGTAQQSKSNEAGIYSFPGVQPGQYHVTVRKTGFKTIELVGLSLNVQDHVEKNFQLQVGSVSESVTVSINTPTINTEDASVSTVVDRQFAENLPLNGRSFQSLIELTPGVVVTPSNFKDAGQFSVNGQRTGSNYWSVDGAGANIGIGGNLVGNALGGALGSFSAFGGTNSLVSVDALQEFRIQTSTYAPEFGRVPGGQISILTRSGTNEFHGTAFDYLRNDALDANDWFANFAGLPKPKERQNDFGGTLGGPILGKKTFFFFSYEGLRLRLPQTELTLVPDVLARQTAIPAVRPFLNVFPLPNGPDDPAAGTAQLNATFSNPASLDAVSLRIDHKLTDKWNLFARYNYSPSEIIERGGGSAALSETSTFRVLTRTLTLGATTVVTPAVNNDFRFNYSLVSAGGTSSIDTFMGATPPTGFPFPSGVNGEWSIDIFSLTNGIGIGEGGGISNVQRQINIVDNLSLQRRSHTLKFGIDFRRLSPSSVLPPYGQLDGFGSVPSAESGNLEFSAILAESRTDLLFKNLGLFAQDTWRIKPRLTITYGLRWDVDFAPSTISGPNLDAVTGFNLQNLSNLALAPAGAPPFGTRYGSVAPRVGLAYQIPHATSWQTVIRGGFGIFYDLVTSEAGNNYSPDIFPFGNQAFSVGGTFPLSQAAAAPLPIVPPNATNGETLFAFDPNLRIPYNMQWSAALEQALGQQQTLTATYIGSVGRRLLQTALVKLPNSNFTEADLTTNTATSDYSALQIQFDRRLSRGLQALASYTWAHSIDQGSSSQGSDSDVLAAFNSKANRGPSTFDIRNTFSLGLTYDVPSPKINRVVKSVLRDWSMQNIVQARSAPPVDVSDLNFSQVTFSNLQLSVRPDVVPGQPLYLFGAQCVAVLGPPCAGGKGFNPAAFTDPPVDPATGLPARQGTLGRNALRGFGATQWDLAVHRDFPLHESVRLQLRAELFNVLNHPNFGPPSGAFGFAGFGVATQTLGQSLNSGFSGNLGNGAFDPLYQLGGPRSVQFGLKLTF